MDIKKQLEIKKARIKRREKFNKVMLKILKPLIYIERKMQDNKKKKYDIRYNKGKNMTEFEAAEMVSEMIIKNLIKYENNIEIIVAEFGYSDYDLTTIIQYVENNIKPDDVELKGFIYNIPYQNRLEFNEKFTDLVRGFLYSTVDTKYIIDKDRYGYYKSKDYKRTLIISLGDNNEVY